MVSEEGELLGAGWRGVVPAPKNEAKGRLWEEGKGRAGGKMDGKGGGKGDFEMVVQERGVRAVIEKGAAGGAKLKKGGEQKEGEEGEGEEKTFLQK